MSSSFFGFTIGMSALSVNQRALEVISHNIANINTPGHSKQEAIITASSPQYLTTLNRSVNAGQIGSGVEVEQVRRMRDEYADRQLRSELMNQGKWEYSVDILSQTGIIFSEPGENGLSSALDDYWNAWNELEASPEDMTKRKSLVESTKMLTSFLQSVDTRLTQLQFDINIEVKNKITEINNYASQITELNKSIKASKIVGDVPNDLMDKRDSLIDDLSKIINVSVKEGEFGQIDLYIGSKTLVRGDQCTQINAELDATTKFYNIKWNDDGTTVSLQNGELYALKNFRDDYIPGIISKMDDFVSTLITETNAVHSDGYGLDGVSTGNNFFTGTGIKDIEINPDIEDDTTLIAAASNSGQSGDNSNISKIVGLRDALLLNSGTISFDNYYNNLISQIGIDGQQSARELENTELLIDKVNARKDSISGVSLDEELVNMVKFQHAYNAAAKIITTMDELFDTLINKM
jgi:flagellar hook-associated protein 1